MLHLAELYNLRRFYAFILEEESHLSLDCARFGYRHMASVEKEYLLEAW